MVPSDTLRLLAPAAIALALLLVAGVAALVHLWRGASAFSTPWKILLMRFAAVNPWRGRDLVALLALVALAQIVRTRLPVSTWREVLTFQGAVLAGGFWLARHKSHPFGAPAPLKAVATQALLRWLAILPLLWFFAFIWQALLTAMGHAPDLQNSIRIFIGSQNVLQRVEFLLFAVLLAPVAEEILFRGILLPLLIRRAGATGGLLLTAIGFAALHGDLGTFMPLAAISIALSLAYARTGTILVPMTMHALFNGVNLALLWVLARAGVLT